MLEVPGEEVRPRYKVNFFNNNDVAFVALSGLYDFVINYKQWAPKKFSQSNRDKAIAMALRYVPQGTLDEEKQVAGVDSLPVECM